MYITSTILLLYAKIIQMEVNMISTTFITILTMILYANRNLHKRNAQPARILVLVIPYFRQL